ncbi:hypothetical protein BH10CYA1_BH10CYA1_12070 [soil metagenome]
MGKDNPEPFDSKSRQYEPTISWQDVVFGHASRETLKSLQSVASENFEAMKNLLPRQDIAGTGDYAIAKGYNSRDDVYNT